MSPEREFVPMSEANTERVRTTATLPFQLHERVGLNVKRIHSICQLAGFSHLKIQNDPSGETSQAVPQIVGLDRNGSAVAGKAAVKNVPTYQSDYSPDPVFDVGRPMKQAVWKNLTVSLNTEEMKQRILLSDERVTDSSEWGKQIDEALKKATLRSGVRHLVGDIGRVEKILSLFFYTLVYSEDLVSIAKDDTSLLEAIPMFATSFALTGVVMTAMNSLAYGTEKPGEGRRASFFFGPELDRAIALAVSTYTGRLAKGLSEDG